jgi:hypothetical protein
MTDEIRKERWEQINKLSNKKPFSEERILNEILNISKIIFEAIEKRKSTRYFISKNYDENGMDDGR